MTNGSQGIIENNDSVSCNNLIAGGGFALSSYLPDAVVCSCCLLFCAFCASDLTFFVFHFVSHFGCLLISQIILLLIQILLPTVQTVTRPDFRNKAALFRHTAYSGMTYLIYFCRWMNDKCCTLLSCI